MTVFVKTELEALVTFGNGKAIPTELGEINAYGGNGVIKKVPKPNYPKNTIIVGRVGSQCGNVHKSKESCWVTDNALAGTPKHQSDFEFLYYLLKQLRLNELRVGSGQPLITQTILRSINVDVPSSPEYRRKIASVLSNLDAKIELNNQINAELEAMAKLLYDYWFVQFDFPMTAAQAASLGRPALEGKPYKSSGGKMVHNPTLNRQTPDGWTGDNIFKLSELGGGGTPTKKRADYWTGHIPFFTPTDALPVPFLLDTEAHITEAALKNSSTTLFPAGSLFLTARGSVGKVMITGCEMAMSQSCYALIPHKGVSSQFLYFQTLGLMGYLKAKSSGSIFKSIVTNDIKYSPTIIPPKEMITAFSEKTEAMFEQIKNNLRQNQELTQLRDWLLPMLMNGQVTVGA